jgi:sulfatase modifying factor 1
MARMQVFLGILAAVIVPTIVGCGGTTTGTERHVDVVDAAAGGAGTSSGGSGNFGLGACNDGPLARLGATGNTDCCPDGAKSGASCSYASTTCFTRCTNGLRSQMSCSGGVWLGGHGVIPCGPSGAGDAGLSGPAACVAAGGQCVLGDIGCSKVGPQACAPGGGPGGAICCLDPSTPSRSPDAGPGCPATLGTSQMVRIPAPDGTTYCIDSTEVTNYQYLRFLQAKKTVDGGTDTSGQDAWCSWNTTYEPQDLGCVAQFDAYARPDYPMVCVDWCDAFAFCKWAGKRLCGKIGGGANSSTDYADATKSEWFNACSKGGTLVYPYGNTFDANACNGAPLSLNRTMVVGSMANCEGGYRGLFDLSGNVWEWEDSCTGTAGMTADIGDSCRVRGASFNDSNSGLACGSEYADPRNSVGSNVGFRCCAE